MLTEELLKKQNFVEELSVVFRKYDIDDIAAMHYHYKDPQYDTYDNVQYKDDELVSIIYKSGARKVVNVSMDSCEGIYKDIFKRLFLWD